MSTTTTSTKILGCLKTGKDELETALIVETSEAKLLVSRSDHVGNNTSARACHDRCSEGCWGRLDHAEIERHLARVQLRAAGLEENGQLGVIVCRPQMLDYLAPSTFADGDLDRGRARSGLHFPKERAHPGRIA